MLLVGLRQCSFVTDALLIAQELLICVVHNEIKVGAVGIGFTDFVTPRYQGSETIYKKRKRDSISYTGSNDRKGKWREQRESPDEPIRKKAMQQKSSKKGAKLNPHDL